MEALRTTTTARTTRPLWDRHRAWARARRRHHQEQQQRAPDVVAAAPRPLPPWSAPPQPQQHPFDDDASPTLNSPKAPKHDYDDNDDSLRRAALRELLGGLRDDAALAALDARAPGAADFTQPALSATLDALGAVLGLERRHLLRVVGLAPRLLTDPSRARRVIEALGRVLGAPRPTDVAAYGRAFPPLFALVPDDDDGLEERGGGSDAEEEEQEEEAGLRGRVRALARLLVVGAAVPPPFSSPPSSSVVERRFRDWAREYPPRAAALLSQPASEVADKVSRLEAALGPAAGGEEAAAAAAAARAAARLLALARPMLLDVGAVVLRSRVVALADAARVDPLELAALALSAGGGGGGVGGEGSDAPLVPPGVQGLAELLMCAPQRLNDWLEALSSLLLLPTPAEPRTPQPQQQQQPQRQKDALPLAAAAAAPGGNPRAFVLETLLLIGARNPSDVFVRWRSVQTAVWRRPTWREEVERRWTAKEVAAALTARHDQLARVAFLASTSASASASAAAQELGLMEAIRGTSDFDRRFPEFRRWLDGKE